MWEQRSWAVILLFRAREQTAWASILSLIWALLCAYNITRRLKDRTESTICCGDHQPYGLSIIKRCICSSPPMRRGFLPESNKAFISVTRLTLQTVFLGSVTFRHTFCSHKALTITNVFSSLKKGMKRSKIYKKNVVFRDKDRNKR